MDTISGFLEANISIIIQCSPKYASISIFYSLCEPFFRLGRIEGWLLSEANSTEDSDGRQIHHVIQEFTSFTIS